MNGYLITWCDYGDLPSIIGVVIYGPVVPPSSDGKAEIHLGDGYVIEQQHGKYHRIARGSFAVPGLNERGAVNVYCRLDDEIRPDDVPGCILYPEEEFYIHRVGRKNEDNEPGITSTVSDRPVELHHSVDNETEPDHRQSHILRDIDGEEHTVSGDQSAVPLGAGNGKIVVYHIDIYQRRHVIVHM